ncbi:alpha/beta hydrolase [Actinomycetaceae bacterium MB13-C1-2]|nr:alpha/beta hydrolase [Actinomycetaceae bacterium MB13-C1-2]
MSKRSQSRQNRSRDNEPELIRPGSHDPGQEEANLELDLDLNLEEELTDAEIESKFPETVPSGSKEQGSLPSPEALVPWGEAGAPAPDSWVIDVLGGPFESMATNLGDDDEGPVVATLVRRRFADTFRGRRAKKHAKFALLFVHGRNDYFYHSEFAERIAELGGAFYALDLRKYGRSLRPWQTIGYTDDLEVYDEELNWATQMIRQEFPHLPLVVMGHSTGGLIIPLWARRNKGVVSGMILNSAWLELQTMTAIRPALQRVTTQLARVRPRASVVGQSKNNAYYRTIAEGWAGSGFELPKDLIALEDDPAVRGWNPFPQWKLPFSYPAPAAWMQTILEGHAEVERGLDLDFPILSMASTATGDEEEWTPEVFTSDLVLNAKLIAERSAVLGRQVTIERFSGKHDLLLSDQPVREAIYDTVARWLKFAQICGSGR